MYILHKNIHRSLCILRIDNTQKTVYNSIRKGEIHKASQGGSQEYKIRVRADKPERKGQENLDNLKPLTTCHNKPKEKEKTNCPETNFLPKSKALTNGKNS